jgi:hypothetical protein
VRASAHLAENPFFVLELPPTATRAEIERTGQRLLAELSLERESSRAYRTPVGRMERTPDAVRTAVAELRDPARRLEHEVWAAVPLRDAPDDDPEEIFPWSNAESVFGLKAR